MHTSAIFLIASLMADSAVAANSQVVFIGSDESASMRDVAVLVFNQPGKDIKVKTLVTAITPEEHVAGKDVRQATLAVVKPGKYGIAAYCVYTMRDILMQERVTLAAGSRYLISCEGSTPRVVKLVIAEQSSSD